jgi:hypothetical protein
MAIRADMRGVVVGRAGDNKAVFELMNRMKQNPAFPEVNLVHIRETGAGAGDVVYTISFHFVRPVSSGEVVERSPQ